MMSLQKCLKIFVFFLGSFISLVGTAWSAEWNVDEFKVDDEKLNEQEIQTFEKTFKNPNQTEGETRGVMGVLMINAPYDVVWEVISDWEKQSDFVPGLEYFKVKYVFPNGSPMQWHSLVEGQLDIPFVSFRYTLDAQFDKNEGTMVWNMLTPDDIDKYQAEKVDVRRSDEDRLKNIEGFGKIKKYDEARTIYYYAPIVEVSVPIPGFVEDIISKISLARYLDAIKERAEKVHQRARVESPKRVADSLEEVTFE